MSDAAERWQPRVLTSIRSDPKALEVIAEQARRTGYDEGFAQGQAEARKGAEETANELAALWASMEKPIADQEKLASEHLLSLVIAIVKTILAKELPLDETLIKDTLAGGLATLAESEAPITITLSPADKALVEDLLAARRVTAELVPDASMLRGGCRIERGHALVDATIEARLQTLIAQLSGLTPGPSSSQEQREALDPDRIREIASRFVSDDGNE
jgi:flagellar assembly protein FliH